MIEENTLAEIQQKLDAANARIEKQTTENAALSRIVDKFKDVDIEGLTKQAQKYANMDGDYLARFDEFQKATETAEEEKLLKSGGVDAVISHRLKAFQDKSDAEKDGLTSRIAELEEINTKATAKSRDDLLQIATRDAVSASDKFLSGQEEFITFKMGNFIKWDDNDAPYLEDNGKRLVSPENSTKDMSIAEFIGTELPKIAPSILKSTNGVGGKGSGENMTDNNPFMDKSKIMEQGKIRKENPDQAKRLAQQARDAGKGKNIQISNV